MRRDSIFYTLFQQFPSLVFDLLPTPPPNAANYRFASVAVKEPKFEIDGVFLPPETEPAGVVYLCEVQFQKDEQLYERLFAELFLYFYRNRQQFFDWQAVIIYPSCKLEQRVLTPYKELLESTKVHRIYLDEIGNIQQLPLEMALMVLTTVDEVNAPEEGRHLLDRAKREAPTAVKSHAIIEMITTIMVYKFTQLSRKEVEQMLDIRLQETRVYQEAKEEGREEEARSLILRLLTHRFGKLSALVHAQISNLSLSLLEDLGESLLDFDDAAELTHWLQAHQQ